MWSIYQLHLIFFLRVQMGRIARYPEEQFLSDVATIIFPLRVSQRWCWRWRNWKNILTILILWKAYIHIQLHNTTFYIGWKFGRKAFAVTSIDIAHQLEHQIPGQKVRVFAFKLFSEVYDSSRKKKLRFANSSSIFNVNRRTIMKLVATLYPVLLSKCLYVYYVRTPAHTSPLLTRGTKLGL